MPTPRRRTINLSETKARQIAIASAFLGCSGETWIAQAIDNALAELAGSRPFIRDAFESIGK